MGTNFKAALLPPGIRNTIRGWGKEARRRRKRRLMRFTDRSTIETETCSIIVTDTNTITSVEEDYHQLIDMHEPHGSTFSDIELQPVAKVKSSHTVGSF